MLDLEAWHDDGKRRLEATLAADAPAKKVQETRIGEKARKPSNARASGPPQTRGHT